MALGLEKRIEIPKRALHITLSRHLIEAHFQKDLSELCTYFKQWMEVTTLRSLTYCIKVVSFELSLFP